MLGLRGGEVVAVTLEMDGAPGGSKARVPSLALSTTLLVPLSKACLFSGLCLLHLKNKDVVTRLRLRTGKCSPPCQDPLPEPMANKADRPGLLRILLNCVPHSYYQAEDTMG